MKSIGLIGGGNMGEAIIAGTRKKYKVSVCEANDARASFLKKKYRITVGDLTVVVKKSDVVILAVKPQDFVEVLNRLTGISLKGKIIVSIAAGITVAFIEEHLGKKTKVVRTMPNMPALIGEGITAVCQGTFASPQDVKTVCEILSGIGETVVVKENLMDAITATSGSGPAYVFLFVESFMNAAKSLGLSPEQAKELVYKTLTGSAHLLEKSKDDAAALRSKVTSKGGTTQAAMDAFWSNQFGNIFLKALTAARNRARELAK